jgi:dTDP-4-dehydrorhamnose reductase
MRILVTGASGLLGLNLSLAVMPSHMVIGVDRSKLAGVPFELINLDLLEAGVLDRMLESVRPEWLIHCAALADMEACERDPAGSHALNAELPGKLATACRKQGVKMLHISTDSVFDGTKEGFYCEEDAPNPQGVYARTKLEGEQVVLNLNPQACVVRVNFFGWSLTGRHGLAEFFVHNLNAGKPVNGFKDVYFCPLFVGDLAVVLIKMLEKNLSGLYHAVGSEVTSKYEFGREIARVFGWNENQISPISVEDSGLKARRSHNMRLSVHRLSTALGMDIPGYSTGLKQFYTQAQQGYPQKIASFQQVPSVS